MTFLDHAMTERITAEARETHFWRTVLTAIAALLFGIGWIAAKTWFAVAWGATAVKMGWREARKTDRTT